MNPNWLSFLPLDQEDYNLSGVQSKNVPPNTAAHIPAHPCQGIRRKGIKITTIAPMTKVRTTATPALVKRSRTNLSLSYSPVLPSSSKDDVAVWKELYPFLYYTPIYELRQVFG